MREKSSYNYSDKKKASDAGKKGGAGVLEKYGKNHFSQLSKKRWGKLSTSTDDTGQGQEKS